MNSAITEKVSHTDSNRDENLHYCGQLTTLGWRCYLTDVSKQRVNETSQD